MQFSSEEELDEVPLNEFEDSKAGILISAEMPVDSGVYDDSQQAAEAMVQLGQMTYYEHAEGEVNDDLVYKGLLFFTFDCCVHIVKFLLFYLLLEDSMDVDPNYDPSDFLMAGLPKEEVKVESNKIQDDLAVSESEDEGGNVNASGHILDDDDGGELWF